MKRALKLSLLGLLLWLAGAVGVRAQASVDWGGEIGKLHYAQISWVASVTAGVTQYNIYRSDVSGSGYQQIDSIASTGQQLQSYQDDGLPAGKTYFYVLTAVGPGGESVFSSQVTAVVPTP